MKLFKALTIQENESLLKFPAYITFLAASSDDKLDETERNSAIKFAHTKTFSCDTILAEFYKEADKVFENNIDQLERKLPIDKNSRVASIKKELLKLDTIVQKLGDEFATTMHSSMKLFKDHVSKAHHNILVDFIFPLPMPGLTE